MEEEVKVEETVVEETPVVVEEEVETELTGGETVVQEEVVA